MRHLPMPPGLASDERDGDRRAERPHPQGRSGRHAQLSVKRNSDVLEMRFAARIGEKPDISNSCTPGSSPTGAGPWRNPQWRGRRQLSG
jgi:hypothetical protein